MKKNSLIYLSLIIIFLLFTGASCTSCKKVSGGGVYKSSDKAESWVAKTFINKVKNKTYTIAEYNILCFEIDPDDSNYIYAGTKGHGLIVSPNGGDSWESTGLTSGNINSIDIDPYDYTKIYVAQDSSILKSTDEGETWETIHTDTNKKTFVKILIDTYDTNKIYAASQSGIVYKSYDQGVNWTIVLQLADGIENLFMRKKDTRILYVLTAADNVYYTISGGESPFDYNKTIAAKDNKELTVNDNWLTIFTKEEKKAWPNAAKAKNLFISPTDDNAIYITNSYSLQKSTDNGNSWEEIRTLIPVNSKDNEKITNFLIDPMEPNIMYFTLSSSNKIYKSIDTGLNWKLIENFPSSKLIYTLIIKTDDTNILYAGMQIPEEKKGLIK